MFAGAEIQALLTGAQEALGQGQSAFSNRYFYDKHSSRSLEEKSGDDSDHLDLSGEAREILHREREKESFDALFKSGKNQRDINQDRIEEQLKQIKEQIDFLNDLLEEGTPKQTDHLIRRAEQTGKALQSLSRELGVDRSQNTLQISQQQLDVQAFSLTARFNSIATYETSDGRQITLEQNIDIQFDYVQIAYSEQSLSLASAPSAPEDLLNDFRSLTQGFNDFLSEMQSILSSEDRVPPSLSQIIRDLLSAALENNQEHYLDQTA